MGQPYIGECRLVGFNFAPVGWLMCQGQTLPISDFEALFTLIGTTYGGNGQTNFLIPDLQGRTPIHQGTARTGEAFAIGQKAGVEQVTLIAAQMPSHNHKLIASGSNGNSNNPQNNVLAGNATQVYVTNPAPLRAMNAAAITMTGGSQPHENRQPFLTMTWVISLYGVFPTPG